MPTDTRNSTWLRVRRGMAALDAAEDHVMAGDWSAAISAFAHARAILREHAGGGHGPLQALLHDAGQWLALTDANAATAELRLVRARLQQALGDAPEPTRAGLPARTP